MGFSPQTLGHQWAFALVTRWLLAWRFPPSFLRLAPVGASVSLLYSRDSHGQEWYRWGRPRESPLAFA